MKHNGRIETRGARADQSARASTYPKRARGIENRRRQGLVGTDKDATVDVQTAQALARLDAILTEAGSSRDKLLSITIYLRDIDRARAARVVLFFFRRVAAAPRAGTSRPGRGEAASAFRGGPQESGRGESVADGRALSPRAASPQATSRA